MEKTQEIILSTVIFFDLFDFPLKTEEIQTYLGRNEQGENLLKSWSEKGLIEQQEGYWFLKGREKLVHIRQEREERAKKLWKKVDRYLWLMRSIPFIRMIAVCNNLSYNNPSEKSDIDLFVVTEKNRLFTARTLVTFWLHLFGVRRHGKKIIGRFCLSFFITENHLNLEAIKLQPHDTYLAYWIMNLKPILGENTYKNFMKANRKWLSEYFPHFNTLSEKRELATNTDNLRSTQEKILNSPFGQFLENILRSWQLKRARNKAKKLQIHPPAVIINDQILKFHDGDARKKIQNQFLSRFRNSI